MGDICHMRWLPLLLCMFIVSVTSRAQMKVDTTRTSVTVHYTVAGVPKTLSIFRSYVPDEGLRYQAVYQPSAAEVGRESEISRAKFTDEVVHLKSMLDAAMQRKMLNFSRFSINMLPYIDFSSRLVQVYTTSPVWKAYIRKAGGQLYRDIELMDGSTVKELSYDIKVAAAVFDSSDLLREMTQLFAPYGYKVISGGFPEEHQQIISTDKLMMLGKDPNLFVPVPNMYCKLVRIKK